MTVFGSSGPNHRNSLRLPSADPPSGASSVSDTTRPDVGHARCCYRRKRDPAYAGRAATAKWQDETRGKVVRILWDHAQALFASRFVLANVRYWHKVEAPRRVAREPLSTRSGHQDRRRRCLLLLQPSSTKCEGVNPSSRATLAASCTSESLNGLSYESCESCAGR